MGAIVLFSEGIVKRAIVISISGAIMERIVVGAAVGAIVETIEVAFVGTIKIQYTIKNNKILKFKNWFTFEIKIEQNVWIFSMQNSYIFC